MKYKFRKIKLTEINGHKLINQDTEWVLVIDNIFELLEVHIAVQPYFVQKAYKNLLAVSKNTPQKKVAHFSDPLALTANAVAEVHNTDIVDAMGIVMEAKLDIMSKVLREGKTLYLKSNWQGWCTHIDGYEILDEIEKKDLVFPDPKKDIYINRWYDGKHYYAKVGALTVEIDGEQKWNTYDDAKRNALLFIEKENL